MNTKILEFVVCVEAIMYLLLYNLHDWTFIWGAKWLFNTNYKKQYY